MAMDWSNEQAIPARDALLRVGSLGALGLGLGAVHLLTGFGIPCPFRAVTGWLCPLCGGTHMAESLIRGDLVSAWADNPLALVLAVLVGVRAVGWMVEVVRDPAAVSRRWLPMAWRRYGFSAGLLVCVAYVLARNVGVG
ncbi:MAG: DUF2752 domain-containing protein [Actinobacteria bacterium]|nr:DUF2752 domain-containing protein [Actinomycetota bacterium]